MRTDFAHKRHNKGILHLWGGRGAKREGEGKGVEGWMDGWMLEKAQWDPSSYMGYQL